MSSYSVQKSPVTIRNIQATQLKVAFGDPASNDRIVQDASQALTSLALTGGKLVLVTGPASLPVAFVLAHVINHLFAAVGIFDPKLAGYVVAVSHDPDFPFGTVVPAADVQ